MQSSSLAIEPYAPPGLTGSGRDALKADQFLRFISDIRFQPSWRYWADKSADYYDGNQLDPGTLQALEAKGMGPIIKNVVAPIVNVVLGMEAKTRTDPRCSADDERHVPVADAMSAKLKEVSREAMVDRACSDAYAAQIKAGLGWVYVGRPLNPFEYPYKVEYVHRREMFWDWRAKQADLKDARYVIRKRWYDVDEAAAYFPNWENLLRCAVGDQLTYKIIRESRGTELGMSLEAERALDMEDYEEWRQTDRKRVCLYEVWSRHFHRGHIIRLPDGRVFEFDKKNKMHVALAQRGVVRPEEAVYSRLHLSIWCGPNRLYATPIKSGRIPYVPFWGYREDRTGVPYGLIRNMISQQDEVNARRQKLMWLLGAKRVLMDADALDPETMDMATMLAEIARPDAVVRLNPNRTNKQGAFQVDENLAAAKEQYDMAMDAESGVQAVVGVFNSLLGRESGANSGRAIDSLVEQGTTALAEINDNYRFARRLVYEQVMELVKEDLLGKAVTVQVETVMGRKRTIELNRVVVNEETGEQMLENDVQNATVKVALDETPSTASHRQQQFVMLSEVMKGMPPELQAAIAPFWMMASDLQHRKDMADAMRKAMGQMVEPQNEQEAAAMQEQQAKAQQLEAINIKGLMLDLREREANISKLEAEAQRALADLGGNPAMDGMRGEYEQRIADAQAAAEKEIDRLTSDLMNTRNASVVRETKLMGEVNKLAAQIESLRGTQESQAILAKAQEERSNLEREIAQINADKERDVARIGAASEAVVTKLQEQIAGLKDELMKRVEAAVASVEKKVEAKDKAVEKPAPAPAAPAAPPPINVALTLEAGAIQVGGGSKTVTIKKNPDGSMTASSDPKPESK